MAAGSCPPALFPQLSQETGAYIDVEGEDENEETALLISGPPSQVCQAKAAIHQIVAESTPVSEQLCVPQRAVGRIIGTSAHPGEAGVVGGVTDLPGQCLRWQIAVQRPNGASVSGQESCSGSGMEAGSCSESALPQFPGALSPTGRGGETVRGICHRSGAKVLCEREADTGLAPVRVIQLLGTRKEVAAAKVSGRHRDWGMARPPSPMLFSFPARNSSWRS